jgi:hypothetical protein
MDAWTRQVGNETVQQRRERETMVRPRVALEQWTLRESTGKDEQPVLELAWLELRVP